MAKERRMVKAIEEQFHRVFFTWREEVKNVPVGEWKKGDVDYLIPARHLVHILEAADFYVSDKSVDEYEWGKLFGGDWEEMKPKELPSKKVALEQLMKVKRFITSRLRKLDDKALYQKEKQSPWTGPILGAKLIYVLRHCQHHVGMTHAELRHRGIKRGGWR